MATDRNDTDEESKDEVIVDPEAALRACQAAAVRAKRWAEEQAREAAVAPASIASDVREMDAKTYRQQARERLRAETARAAAELAMLEAEDAAEAEREEQERLRAAKLAEKQRLAAEALEEERRRELEEIDQRIEARFGEVFTEPPQSPAPAQTNTDAIAAALAEAIADDAAASSPLEAAPERSGELTDLAPPQPTPVADVAEVALAETVSPASVADDAHDAPIEPAPEPRPTEPPARIQPHSHLTPQSVRGGVVVPVPPPPARRKARLRVSASVLIDHFGTLVALPLVNVSLTGALVSTVDITRPKMRIGQLLLITLFATDEPGRQVDLAARVVRRTETEAALDWTGDANAMHGVAVLLDGMLSP